DRAAFRILGNEPMLEIARAQPTELAALRAIRGVGTELVERRGRELLAAVRGALELPETALPRLERPARRPADPEYEARLDRLKAARNRLAQEFDLAPGVLCPNSTLEAIARAVPTTVDELRRIPGIRRWQVEAFGPALLAALPPG